MSHTAAARTSLIQVVVAVPNRRVGRVLAQGALAAGLAACVQISGPMTSHYVWKGRTESAREHLVFFKTRRSCFRALARLVRTLHPYEVPEILLFPIVAADAAYARWMEQSLRRPSRSRRRA